MKPMTLRKALSAALATLLLAGAVALPAPVAVSAAGEPLVYGGTSVTEHIGGYDHYDRQVVTYAYDFSMDRIGLYANDSGLILGNRAAAEISDGTLRVKEGLEFSFGSAVCLGDDYGLEEGYLSFDLSLSTGKVYLGLRTTKTASTPDDPGIWFAFDGSEEMLFVDRTAGAIGKLPMPVSVDKMTTVDVHEGLDQITLSVGGTTVARVTFRDNGTLAVSDGEGNIIRETDKSTLPVAGYFSLYMEKTDAAIDNLRYTNVEHTRPVEETDELRLIDYSTWIASDALDRITPTAAEAGEPKDNRYVGLFYFLCVTGAGIHISDNTADYLEYGADGIKARIEERAGEAYWAEPYFGYYRNTDTWVYRKHAYMLEAAGVDFIFLDVSNGVVFPEGHMALFDTWLRMRREGNDTPKIVFFNGDTTAYMDSNMRTLFTTVYSESNWEKYEELFFEWEGKPLVFGNMSGVSADMKALINEKFTVRGSWAWQDKDNYWSWIQEYLYMNGRAKLTNGGWGRDAEGNLESLSIAMGHHPTMSKGRSFVNGKQPNNGLGDFEFSSIEQAGLGLGFENQYTAVKTLIEKSVPAEDPFVLLITGWNEWIAGGFTNDAPVNLANNTCKVQYVDQFNAEFSRDGEPMRNKDGYGFGDNYYYQMASIIRDYKGISETPVAEHQGSINIYDLSSWDDIELSYMDPLYDTELRNTVAYDAAIRYINHSGRNDLASCKVSQDENAFYFLVTAAHDIVIDSGESWMNLYLNTDGDMTTGWEGYDYVLNRDRDSFAITVEKFKDNTFETEVVGGAYYYLEGDSMAIRVSKDLLGIKGKCDRLVFKWADNSVTDGDAMGFMDLGDTAPDNRFGYLYLCEDYTTSPLPAVTLVTDVTTAPQNGAAMAKPDHEIKIEIVDDKVDHFFNFSDILAGLYFADTPMADLFEYHVGSAQSNAQVRKEESGNRYLRAQGYSDIRSWEDVEGAYTFTASLRLEKYGMSALYVRGEMPGAYAPENPKNFGIDQVFHYYEWDWYAENGGSTYGPSSPGGSGIGIFSMENGVMIRIKRYAPDGLGVASASYDLPYTDDFKPDENGWLRIRCEDDGERLSIYFNDALMCVCRLEEPGVTYPTDGTGQAYYGKVTVLDAVGDEVMVVENTRVNSSGSQLALASRNEVMEIDDLGITYATKRAEGGRVETALGGSNATVPYTPSTRLLGTLDLGRDASAESDTDPVTDPDSSVAPTPEPKPNKGCASAMATPALLSAVALGAWLTLRKKKH